MSDLNLFRLADGKVEQLVPETAPLEKQLQNLIEKNLYALFGVRFLASEYPTSTGGRMDTLGIDENGYPVIIEYKRTKSENVINQGLFYLDWLMDHQADFTMLAMKKLGPEVGNEVGWSTPRLICVAEDFTKYDEFAVRQMNRNIELVRYRRYDNELLLFELVNAVEGAEIQPKLVSSPSRSEKGVDDYIEQADEELRGLYDSVGAFLLALGDDVQEKHTKFYVAFRRLKNFACVEVHPQSKTVLVYVKVDPSTVDLEDGFTRDVTNIGHFGTGDLEIRLTSLDDFERAQPLLEQSYQLS